MSSVQNKTAEEKFREAFVRLKSNKPLIMPINTPVSQNNVAKEAGKHPTALKKNRYPTLIREIKAYLENIPHTQGKTRLNKRRTARKLKDKLLDLTAQRDRLTSIVESQDVYISELLERIDDLENNSQIASITEIKKT
jgi:vacuolar-type H+-ATPase subunit I/STV1